MFSAHVGFGVFLKMIVLIILLFLILSNMNEIGCYCISFGWRVNMKWSKMSSFYYKKPHKYKTASIFDFF